MLRIRKLFALDLILVLFAPAVVHAETPAETVVRGFYAQLESSMKQGPKLGFSGRYKKLDPTIRAAFNLPLMTRLAVGASWDEATPQQQANLIAAFSDFSVATYANRFSGYDGEQFIISGEKPVTEGQNGVIVETNLKTKTGDLIALNYLMRPDEQGHYRIVDVFLNGTISELATQHAELSSIARRDGIPALVNSLDEKSKQLGPS